MATKNFIKFAPFIIITLIVIILVIVIISGIVPRVKVPGQDIAHTIGSGIKDAVNSIGGG